MARNASGTCYAKRLAAGVCTRCGEANPRPGHVECDACAAAGRKRAADLYRQRNPSAGTVPRGRPWGSKNRAAPGEWTYERRKAAGLCTRCGKNRPDNTQTVCQPCKIGRSATTAAYNAERKASGRERDSKLRYNYGITLADWEALFASQGKCCAICGGTEHKDKGWHTDHCHATGKVRGILCGPCNKGIGHFFDNPLTLQRAARYVVLHGAACPELESSHG